MAVLEKEGGMPELERWVNPKKIHKLITPKIKQWLKDNEIALNESLQAEDLKMLPNIQKGIQINNDTSLKFLPPYDLLIQKIHFGTSKVPKLLFLDLIFKTIYEEVNKEFLALNL